MVAKQQSPTARKPRSDNGRTRTRRVLTPLSFDSIKITPQVDRDTMGQFAPARGGLTAEQKQVNELVSAAYAAWLDAGRPTTWADIPGTFLLLPDDQVETLQIMVRKAGVKYNVRIKFGRVESEDGFSQVVFTATDRPQKDSDAS